MAEAPTQLDKPQGAGAKPEETVIHVIPAEFYGAPASVRKAATPSATAQPAPVPPTAPAKKKGGLGVLLAVVVVVLLAGAGAGYYFLVYKKPATSPAPICGNQQCEAGETYIACPSDCQPPAPICGNQQCEAGETYAACPSDCQPPAPICGNQQCEAGETYAACPSDCPPPAPVCGDGKCEEGKETLESCPSDCRPPEPVAGQDLDSDGLTDREETEIYGTDPRNADSDADSYVDLNELVNLYNPARPLPSLLKENPGVILFENAAQKYSVFRPTSWALRDNAADRSEVFFTAPDGEFIEVLVEPKPEGQALMDWYLSQAPGLRASEVTAFKIKQGRSALQSPDKMTAYVDVGNRVIVLAYNLGDRNEMQYRATFLMMIQSVRAERMETPPVPAPAVEPATAAGTDEPATVSGR